MIDIIISVYNSRDTLFRTLASIALQSIKEKTLIYIVDDCSSYLYDDIIGKFSCDLDIKFYKLNKNSGPGVARQYLLEKTTSEFVCFMDADDIFFSYKSLEILFNKINNGYDYVFGKVYDERSNADNYTLSDLHGKLYRRNFIMKYNIQFPNGYVHEDNVFNNLVRVNNPKTGLVDDIIYVYCNNVNSITSVDSELEFERLEVLINYTDFVIGWALKNKCLDDLIKQFIYEKTNYFSKYYRNVSDNKKEKLKRLIDNSLLDSKYLFETNNLLMRESILNEDISKYISKLS